MEIYDCRQWVEDIDAVMSVVPDLSELAGKNVLITGATGLIGSAVVDILIRYNETHEMPITIMAAGRSAEKMRTRFGRYCDRSYFRFIQYDATTDCNNLPRVCDYIIYGAGNATPDKMLREPVETMSGNFVGMLKLLQYARVCGTKRVLYISSSEVYGRKEDNDPYREDEYGYVDLLNPRNSYAVGKRAAETLCIGYSAEYGMETVIARPGHIYGPTASPDDTRVSSLWAYAAARGEDIVMKSTGAQVRSYCYCLDCASAILRVLLFGENAHAYNISNPDSVISIKEMGELLARTGGVRLVREIASEQEKRAFNPMNNSSLSSSSLTGLGWEGRFSAEEGLAHTIEILKKIKQRTKS